MSNTALAEMNYLRHVSKKETVTGINPNVKPSGTGCVECLASGTGWWLHLRRCAECGHVGCCNDSPKRHATAHFHATNHPVIQSFEPNEVWMYDFRSDEMIQPVELAEPTSHPVSQPVPFNVHRDAK